MSVQIDSTLLFHCIQIGLLGQPNQPSSIGSFGRSILIIGINPTIANCRSREGNMYPRIRLPKNIIHHAGNVMARMGLSSKVNGPFGGLGVDIQKEILIEEKEFFKKVRKVSIDLTVVFAVRLVFGEAQSGPHRLIDVQDPCRRVVPRIRIGFQHPPSILLFDETDGSVLQKQSIHTGTTRSAIQPEHQRRGDIASGGRGGWCHKPIKDTLIPIR
mmetsp:Transcript_30931/g.71289  ORF Transcript_30931/g.71289 Transcript_30931/m.71289 type:complete len:215 (-) Transcript_30931:186-830(-)